MFTKKRALVSQRQLPMQAYLIINRLRREAMFDRQRAALDVDDDAPHMPSYDLLANAQNRRVATLVS